MSIRSRLIALSLVVALLPAVPLSLIVKSLLEKSFNVGLSNTIEQALQNGTEISRLHLDLIRERFDADVTRLLEYGDFAARRNGPGYVQGVVRAAGPGIPNGDPLQRFRGSAGFEEAIAGMALPLQERKPVTKSAGVRFFESSDRRLALAIGHDRMLFTRLDGEFLARADQLIDARQIFAELRLNRQQLNRSFFYPFVVVYAVMFALSFALAVWISERISNPIRRLASGTRKIAGGDWDYRHSGNTGGEIGRLENAFDDMVAELDTQRKRLVDMERISAWRDVARHLAHEIKNPLLPIRLTVEELRDQYRGDDERYRELLAESTRVIGDELDSLKKLVKEFSSFARMPELKPASGDLMSLITDVSSMYPTITTRFHATQSGHPIVFDADQMRRVFVNLYDNVASLKLPQPLVDVGLSNDGTNATVSFHDNGPGMPEEVAARVFDPYYTTRSDGTGLGLAVVKNVIVLHGGAVRIDRESPSGTRFVISIPVNGPRAS